MAVRGKPIYLNGNDDQVLVYFDKLDTASPPNRTPATALASLTVKICATEALALANTEINAALSKSLT